MSRRRQVMRHTFVLAVFFAALAVSGCSAQQSNQSLSQTQTASADQSNAQLVIAPKVDDVPAHPLPFKGKLISGDTDELPPAIAMSLSDSSPVTFTYREELTHDDYHVPLAVSALDPANLIGAPLGDIGVTAFASLSISAGDTIIADYTAKEHVSKSYNMYHNVTHEGGRRSCARGCAAKDRSKDLQRRSPPGESRRRRPKISDYFRRTMNRRLLLLSLGVVASAAIGCAVQGNAI